MNYFENYCIQVSTVIKRSEELLAAARKEGVETSRGCALLYQGTTLRQFAMVPSFARFLDRFCWH